MWGELMAASLARGRPVPADSLVPVLAYLSDEWITAMDAALTAHAALRQATRDLTLVLQQHVTGRPDGARSYVVRLDHGCNRVVAGRDPSPDITFTCDE